MRVCYLSEGDAAATWDAWVYEGAYVGVVSVFFSSSLAATFFIFHFRFSTLFFFFPFAIFQNKGKARPADRHPAEGFALLWNFLADPWRAVFLPRWRPNPTKRQFISDALRFSVFVCVPSCQSLQFPPPPPPSATIA